MPNRTYETGFDELGRITFTTYKVWTGSRPKTRTFMTLEEASEWYRENQGARLDQIVTTIVSGR